MRANVVVLFVHLALDIQIENTFHARCLHGCRHPRQQCIRFDIGEVFVYQTVGCDDALAGDDCAFGESGTIAYPNILTEDDRLGQRSDFPILVEILHVMERRVHELTIPCGAHVAADHNPVEAEDLEVGADVDIVGAELQRCVVGNHHVGAVSETERTIEDDGAAHCPDALLDGGVHVEVVLPDLDHAGTNRTVNDDIARQTAECHLPIEPHRQLLRHREGKHLEVKPKGFDQVNGPYDV